MGGGGKGRVGRKEKVFFTSVKFAFLIMTVALWAESILLVKQLGKMTDNSIWGSQGENYCSQKSGKQFLARANCEEIRIPGSNAVCPPDCVCSGYLELLLDRKGEEFRRSKANGFVGKISSTAVSWGQILGAAGGEGDRKRERKPNVEGNVVFH